MGSAVPLEGTAIAHPNIALVKYWGKRDTALNLPATGSISITLDTLHTRTRVRFSPEYRADEFFLNHTVATGAATDAPSPASAPQLRKVSAVLDLLRADASTTLHARVDSVNTFPTGAGLASSASGFAALVVAADHALGLGLAPERLSELARRGSGSAARSLIGGFAQMHRGAMADGTDSVATQLLSERDWPLAVVVAITTREAKTTSSSAGMELSRTTSPYYPVWVASADDDLAEARSAIAARDFAALADISEHSCTKMHALMMSTRPALLYWTPASVACLHRIRDLRESAGLATFFTVDAGPQVKAVCLPKDAPQVAEELAAIPGVVEVHTVGLGPGAAVTGNSAFSPHVEAEA